MINYFFSLSMYLTKNTSCLNYKNYFFSLIAYLTENTVYFNPVFTMAK